MGYSEAPWHFRGRALYQLSLVRVEEVRASGGGGGGGGRGLAAAGVLLPTRCPLSSAVN